jgi:two-component system sensor histidine kinase/response regulator
MDLHMPVMDGLEATRRIRRLASAAGVPVIGMTAAAMADDRASCFAAGMVDHLAKPVMPEQLLEVLLRWVAQKAPQNTVKPG